MAFKNSDFVLLKPLCNYSDSMLMVTAQIKKQEVPKPSLPGLHFERVLEYIHVMFFLIIPYILVIMPAPPIAKHPHSCMLSHL